MFFKKKKKGIQADDKVWISKVAKFKGLYRFLEKITEAGAIVLIVHHFDNTQQEVQLMLEKLEVSHQTIEASDMVTNPTNIFVINAHNLSQLSTLPQYLAHGNQLQVIVSEHYPAYERDQEVLQQIKDYLPNAPICFFTSLDEPFMQLFGSDRIIGMMESMGMDENESIAHSMVTKAIMKAQQKVEKHALQTIYTASQQEWFDKREINH
ncbi:hypothetical protein [uncultured Microscilla sp.]|uniref:hypothetical protein n=1 Tax=uncultured Microscilla sp. TaxID=432653 RepID=UPI0026016DA6|nr:hypothetical protein [uncultured Microscilla sp.]